MQKLTFAYKRYSYILNFISIFFFGIYTLIAQLKPTEINGQLRVCGTKLCNQYDKPIQLRGMSTHGIQWYGWGKCLTESSLEALAYDWEADILRISLYVQEGGYESDPSGFTDQVSRLVNEATQRGMYALVDWHQLTPGDPNANLENAKRFFTDIANLHKNNENIIYDICNEPNGSGVNWNRIKSYADQIIPVIRGIDNDAVILVGTQGWATFGVSGEGSLRDVLDNQLSFENVMYTFHFYAKSHREAYLDVLDRASDQLPVFVTEFGSQEYTGDGPNDFAMTQRFIDVMQQKKISWTSWNYSDDFRTGAAWKTGTCSGGPWTTNQLKEAGSWIRDKIKFPADDFPGIDSNDCSTIQYVDGSVYSNGDKVQNLGKEYECIVAGWCSVGGAYAPGEGWAWEYAWKDLGICEGDIENQLPVIEITSPSSGSEYQSGEQVTIAANASDSDGNIAEVTFFMNDVMLGKDNFAPFEITFSPANGMHELKATAVDNQGGSTSSETINIMVNEETGGDTCDLQLYVEGNVYQTGDVVQYLGTKYECKVGGWCSAGGAYIPQDGWAWPYAWEELGPCIGNPVNQLPQVTVLTPQVIYTDALPITIPLKVNAIDPDGSIQRITVEVGGGTLPLQSQGNDIYQSDWTFYNYGTFTYGAQAVDDEEGYTNFDIQVTIKETIQDGDFLMSKEEYNEFFPYRYGTDLTTYELDPARDFFTYESFVEATGRMNNIEVTFERRKGTNLYRLTRRDKTTDQSTIIRIDQDFDAEWNQSKAIVTQVVDYGTFAKEGNETTIKRELAAFLANISQETTGGWTTAPGGPYSWGLHFREEQGYEGTSNLGYRDEGNMNYPPAPGKSYHGRGPIQLSWNYNYGQVSEFLFGDKNVLLNNPEQVAQDAALAFQTAIWFWMTPQYPKPSAHDVMVGNWMPSTYDQERNRKPGFGMTVNIINGGLECGSGTEIPKVLGRIGFYERYTGILNVNNDLDTTNDCSECGCANMQAYFGIEPEPGAFTFRNNTYKQPSDFKISLVSNPIESQLEMIFETNQEAFVNINILDFKGLRITRVLDKKMSVGKNRINHDLSLLPSGIYFLKVNVSGDFKTYKIWKE